MIDTIAIKFGEHDPVKVSSELSRSRRQVNEYVLDTLKKAPHDTWYGFDVLGVGWFGRRKVLKAFRVKLCRELMMGDSDYPCLEPKYFTTIEKYRPAHDGYAGTWHEVRLSIAELLEKNPTMTLEYVIGMIKRAAIETTERNLASICQHTSAMDETREHDEIIECLNKELRFANEL